MLKLCEMCHFIWIQQNDIWFVFILDYVHENTECNDLAASSLYMGLNKINRHHLQNGLK